MPLSCRFYQEKYPEVEDVVMLSRRRIRSINKLIRVGKTEPVVVIRVDKEKGYIDLSKRRVSAEDIDKCTERYAKAKAVNSILRHETGQRKGIHGVLLSPLGRFRQVPAGGA
ncbi:unnamed protein product [Colias eurytheme]|nr:unnamed protein product [Colias eurytheme]